jgi:hypothetical protein
VTEESPTLSNLGSPILALGRSNDRVDAEAKPVGYPNDDQKVVGPEQQQAACEEGEPHFAQSGQRTGFVPKLACDPEWIDPDVVPPRRFIAAVVDLTMMLPAKRNRELVTDLAAARAHLGKAKVMGIGGTRAAEKAGLCPDIT